MKIISYLFHATAKNNATAKEHSMKMPVFAFHNIFMRT